MLGCIGNTFKLSNLRKINIIPEMSRQVKSVCDIIYHFIVAVHTFLVGKKDFTVKVVVLGL